MPSIPYRMGNALGAARGYTKLIICSLAAIALFSIIYFESRRSAEVARQEANLNAAAAAASAAVQIAADKEATALRNLTRLSCISDVDAILSSARASLAKSDPHAAVARLSSCEDWLGTNAKFASAIEAARRELMAKNQRLLQAERRAEVAQRRSEGISLGMSAADVIASSWGKPTKVNRTTTVSGTDEQWVYGEYGGRGYLYFTNGVLKAVQN